MHWSLVTQSVVRLTAPCFYHGVAPGGACAFIQDSIIVNIKKNATFASSTS
jgi:hypothetical protein